MQQGPQRLIDKIFKERWKRKIIAEGEHYEKQWLAGQNKAIDGTVDVVGNSAQNQIRDKIAKFHEILTQL